MIRGEKLPQKFPTKNGKRCRWQYIVNGKNSQQDFPRKRVVPLSCSAKRSWGTIYHTFPQEWMRALSCYNVVRLLNASFRVLWNIWWKRRYAKRRPGGPLRDKIHFGKENIMRDGSRIQFNLNNTLGDL